MNVCVEVISAIIIGYIKHQKKPVLLAISELDMVNTYSKKLMHQIVCSDTNLVIIGGVNSFTSHYEDWTIVADSVEPVCHKSKSKWKWYIWSYWTSNAPLIFLLGRFDVIFLEEDLDVIDYPDLPASWHISRLCGGMPNGQMPLLGWYTLFVNNIERITHGTVGLYRSVWL